MTVVSTVVRAAAAWTGVETEIPTGIQVQDRSQLAISLVPDEGERQALTLGLHYAVTLSPAGVATVVPLMAFPPKPGTVSMVRQTPMTQGYDPTATDTYDAAGHAAALDRSAMRVAELSQKVDDIEASSIVIRDGAASVPAGAVYVSDGKGEAIAGPSAAEIDAARGEAVDAAGAATGAAGAAIGAATMAGNSAALAEQLSNAAPGTPVGGGFSARHWAALAKGLADSFNLDAYATSEQIQALLRGFVPTARRLKVGAGLSIDGDAGSDNEPASAEWSGDRLLELIFATPAEASAGVIEGKPVDPAGLASAIAALAGGAVPKRIVEISATGNYMPSQGCKYILAILRGAGGSGAGANGSSNGGGGGGEGALGIALCAVNSAVSYIANIGGGGPYRTARNDGIAGGTTSLTINGVIYSAGGGGGGTVSGYGGAGGVPSASCLLGYLGAYGSLTTSGASPWRQSGSSFGLGGGPSQASGQPGSTNSGAGYDGHITIMEFGA